MPMSHISRAGSGFANSARHRNRGPRPRRVRRRGSRSERELARERTGDAWPLLCSRQPPTIGRERIERWLLGEHDRVDDRLSRCQLLVEDRWLSDQRDDEHGLTRDQGSALNVVDQFHLLVANRKRQGKGGGRGVRPVRDELDTFLIAVGSDLRYRSPGRADSPPRRHTR